MLCSVCDTVCRCEEIPHYDVAVYIGRFQPFHKAHLETLRLGLRIADIVVVGLGSAQESRTEKNPFTVVEREKMIQAALTPQQFSRVYFMHLYDRKQSDAEWAEQVRTETRRFMEKSISSVCLVGVHKDASSSYLDWFPKWHFMEGPKTELLNATDTRTKLAEGNPAWANNLPDGVVDVIMETGYYKHLKEKNNG